MKKGVWLSVFILISGIFMIGATGVSASDLDDGISKYTDDGVSSYDELGKADRNVKFTVQDAKSRGAVRSKAGQSSTGSSDQKSANMNSVIMGAGGTIRGDVIIIDQSRGDKTQVVE